jgi:hypothetical protein
MAAFVPGIVRWLKIGIGKGFVKNRNPEQKYSGFPFCEKDKKPT